MRYRRAGEPGEAEHLIAVNLSGDESDLDAMAPEELAAVLGDRGRVHRSLDEFARLAAEGGVEEVTAWLWPLLMLLLVVEAFAANRLYRPVEEKE